MLTMELLGAFPNRHALLVQKQVQFRKIILELQTLGQFAMTAELSHQLQLDFKVQRPVTFKHRRNYNENIRTKNISRRHSIPRNDR